MILIAAFIDGVMVDSIRITHESQIPAAKAQLLHFYPEALICRKL